MSRRLTKSPAGAKRASASSSYTRIYSIVSRIPKGRVATYGQVANLAALPRQARLVGYALNVLPHDTDVPWHRVVNAQGRISPRSGDLGHDDLQAQMLAREGVRGHQGAIPLTQFQWRPRAPRNGPPRESGNRLSAPPAKTVRK
jgi:methylated-DNA-protein-cysteine methyltransferase related protein